MWHIKICPLQVETLWAGSRFHTISSAAHEDLLFLSADSMFSRISLVAHEDWILGSRDSVGVVHVS